MTSCCPPVRAAPSLIPISKNSLTMTYHPSHPHYFEEVDVRHEMSRVFNQCSQCGQCLTLCSSFDVLFGYLDNLRVHDAGLLTPEQQDYVSAECVQCNRCVDSCPYSPELSTVAIDVPRLFVRHRAMRLAAGQVSLRHRVNMFVFGRAVLVGKLATTLPTLSNWLLRRTPGSLVRLVLQWVIGLSSRRPVPLFASQRFSAWWNARHSSSLGMTKQASVAVFPTCIVEFQKPEIGHDVVKVFERNGVECSVIGESLCCGAPHLYAGDVKKFASHASRVVSALASVIRDGADVVVPQSHCASIMQREYQHYVGGEDADLVASHAFGASDYLMIMRAQGKELNTSFTRRTVPTIAYCMPSQAAEQHRANVRTDMLSLAGANVRYVDQQRGSDGVWAYAAENHIRSQQLGEALAKALDDAACEVVVSDSHFVNSAVSEVSGTEALHPLQVVARAYGIPQEFD